MDESRGMTLADLLVIMLIVVIVVFLLSTVDGLFPGFKARPVAYRSVCAANLHANGKALAMYANCYRGSFPLITAARMRDSGSPETGLHPRPDEGAVLMFDDCRIPAGQATNQLHRWQGLIEAARAVDPLYPFVRVADKDASCAFPSREVWLLAKGDFSQTAQFVCPSTAHESDDLQADRPASDRHATAARTVFNLRHDTDPLPAADLWDFLEPQTLDYGYMFAHDANGGKANASIDPDHPVMADSNPYIRAGLSGANVPAASNKLNSPNHEGEGQNVLFGDLHVTFFDHPTVGQGGDNIYTAWYSQPSRDGSADVPGIAPQTVAGGAGELPTNYHFDLVSRTDAMLLP